MGKDVKEKTPNARLKKTQIDKLDTYNTTRIVTGGFEKITYKEVINGVTFIRTKWRKKKNKERKKRS